MTYVSDNRVAVRQDISGFVVAEDQSLEARLRRSYRLARDKAQQGAELARGRVGTLALDHAALAGGVSARLVRMAAVVMERLRPGQRWQDQDRTLAAMAQDSGPDVRLRERLGERLRDAASLGGALCSAGARLFWRLPMAVKLLALGLAGLASLLPGSAEGETAMSGVDTAPASVSSAHPGAAVSLQRLDPDLWKPVAAPIAAYHLEAAELDRAALRYKARMHAEGARQELMVWGSTAADAPRKRAQVFGALSIEHYPRAVPEGDTLYIDLVRRAALVGASVERVGAPIGLQTKFGPFETAEATVLANGVRRSCLGYRHVAEDVPLQIHGWFCGTPDRPIDRSVLGCMLDRVDILSAGNDKALRAYFAAVERARLPCGTARLVSPKTSWLDPAGPMPALKASFSAR